MNPALGDEVRPSACAAPAASLPRSGTLDPVRILGALAGWTVVAVVVAVLVVLTIPRQLGLSMVTPIGQVVAFRGLLLGVTLAGLVLWGMVWLVAVLRAHSRRRRGGRAGAGVAMATVLALALAGSAAAHGTVLAHRGFAAEARATVEQVAATAPRHGEITVVALNCQWDSVAPLWVAELAVAGHALMVALPESEADYAQEVADELAGLGQPGWQVFASSSPWPNALLVSPEAGRYRLVDRGHRGLVVAEPVGHDGPVLTTVHAMPPPAVPPWRAGHEFLSMWWTRTVSEAAQVIRDEDHVVAAGDFNATLDHAALDPGLDPATAGSEGWGTWPSSWPAWMGARIDHVYAKPYTAARTSWVVDVPGSDHRAVVTRLTGG